MSDGPSRFAHLQVHSHFTLLGATPSIEQLVARADAEGMSHLALTDTNALYGAVSFDRTCRAAGIQPVLGMTIVAPPLGPHLGRPGRLVLLAKGPAGYRSLCRLSTIMQGCPERDDKHACGLSWDDLRAHAEDLVCLTGGRLGWVMRSAARGDLPAATRYAGRLAGIYGEQNTYLSLELHKPPDGAVAAELSALGERLGLPTVAVQPIFCLLPGEQPKLKLLTAIDHNCPLGSVPAEALPYGDDPAVGVHWLSEAEVRQRFAAFADAVDRTSEVARQCGLVLPDGRPIWPVVDLPAGQSSEDALAQVARDGLLARYGPTPQLAVSTRLEHELTAIGRHGYAPLFLIVADIVRYAREAEVPVSTRGSVANSLVAFCTGITSVDPIAHDLLFERFLNPARADPPDIDLDLCSRRRDDVLEYVRLTYGADRVALVAAINTMRPKSAVRETAKAYGLDEVEIGNLVALLPRSWHPDPRRRDKRTVDDLLADLPSPRLREIVKEAYTLVGQPHHLSIHAGGLTLTPGPLTDWVPLQWTPKGFLTTQFDHKDVEALGLPKIDLLGIRALTVLAETAEMVRTHHDSAFRLADIPVDDPATQVILAAGETIGVFQCESAGSQRTLRQLRAQSVRDLAVANAFFKPGPSTGGMARTFVRRYRGEEQVSYLHPSLEPILGSTKGVLIFQEQILRVAREIAGLSWAQADHLRRGMSKFRSQEMAEMREQFLQGCQRAEPEGPSFSLDQAETLWEQVMAFAGYGFNQGHATAYGDVSYRSAYLKAHWPAAFLCARLAYHGGYHHPAVYMAEALRLGILVKPPHVNHSQSRFSLSWQPDAANRPQACLWMGLGQVRDLRRASVKAIMVERQQGLFSNLRDLLRRVPLQTKEVIHLIQCGALDGLAPNRSALLAEADQVQRAGSAAQMTFDFAKPTAAPESELQLFRWERRLLRTPVSVTPLDLVRDRLPDFVSLRRLPELAGRRITVAGYRLPGWTGGDGFFLADGDTFITVRGKVGQSWDAMLLSGRWLIDEWGGGWFKADRIQIQPRD